MSALLAQANGDPGGGLGLLLSNPLVPLVVVGMLFYIMLWRPEKQRRQQHQQLVENLKNNDRVITAGGIYGTVVNAQQKADYVTLRVDEGSNARIRVSRGSISRVLTGDESAADE